MLSVQLSWYPSKPCIRYLSASQAGQIMSCTPRVVSSTSVRMGFLRVLYSLSPRARASLRSTHREWTMDRKSFGSSGLKAQKSRTCLPWVLMTLISCPCWTENATAFRAGMVGMLRDDF